MERDYEKNHARSPDHQGEKVGSRSKNVGKYHSTYFILYSALLGRALKQMYRMMDCSSVSALPLKL